MLQEPSHLSRISHQKQKENTSARQKVHRQHKTELQKEKDMQKDKHRKNLSRSLKTPTEKDAARQKATFQKATLRAQRAKDRQKKDYSRDKTRKYSSAQQTEKHEPHNPRIQKIPAVSKHRDELTHERKTDKQQNIKSRKTRTSLKHVEDAISRFRDIVSTGPTYACFSCSRFLFRSSVTCFNQKRFTIS